MSKLGSATWWKAAAIRALRTAVIILAPYVPLVVNEGQWLLAVSAAGFGALTSFATSLVGLPEAAGVVVPWWQALIERTVKTAAQALLTAVGAATFFTDVDWSMVGPAIAVSVLGSLLVGVLGFLPESNDSPVKEAREG